MRPRTALLASTAAGFTVVVAMHAGAAPPAVALAPPPQGGSTPTTVPGSTTGVRHATGPTEQYGFGDLAVTVTVDGTHITDVQLAQLQTAESYSQSLAQQVVPMLRNEVLAAQSTSVNGISGATYTVQAYLTSLQSALDALHA